MINLTNNIYIPTIETAHILEDFNYVAKINIPSLMPLIPHNTKSKKIKVSSSNLCNFDKVYQNIPDLVFNNYYELENIGDGYKGENILISFVSEDINQITVI